MKSAIFGLGLLVLGTVLGGTTLGQAQTPAVQWKDLVGTWEEDLTQRSGLVTSRTFRLGSLLYNSFTFRPDSTILGTQVYVDGRDTLAGTRKVRALLIGDTLAVTTVPRSGWWGDTLLLDRQDQRLFLHYWCKWNKQYNRRDGLSHDWKECQTRVYQRADPAQRRFSHIIATGFALRGPALAHTPAPTGTLTDLQGAWQEIPKSGMEDSIWKAHNVVRRIQVFLPDSTILSAEVSKDGNDELVGGGVNGPYTEEALRFKKRNPGMRWGWQGWKREGDSITGYPDVWPRPGKFVLRNNQQLSYYQDGTLLYTLERIALPPQP